MLHHAGLVNAAEYPLLPLTQSPVRYRGLQGLGVRTYREHDGCCETGIWGIPVNRLTHRSALAALLLAAIAPCVASAEPRLLADIEMDAVSAAGVMVDVGAYAQALGTIAFTRTDARALASKPMEGVEIGAGFAEGQAFACCGEGSSVTVGSSAAGSGDAVYRKSVSHVFHGAALTDGALKRFTFSYSAALQVAASSDAPLDARALDDTTSELRRELFDEQTASGHGLITGHAFAPVYTAALRWQAARYLTGQRHSLSSLVTASQAASQRLIGAQQAIWWK